MKTTAGSIRSDCSILNGEWHQAEITQYVYIFSLFSKQFFLQIATTKRDWESFYWVSTHH